MNAVASVQKTDLNAPSAPRDDRKPRTKIEYVRLVGDDAAKLDALFGVKDCLIEVNPGRVLLPPKYQEIGDRILDLAVRDDDVWLVSYPRTGSTWAQEMVWCIGNDLDFEKAKLIQQLRTPLLELTAVLAHDHTQFMDQLGNSVDMVQNMPSPRFIKSHLTWELLPTEIEQKQPKIVYVARNPKDMCVSYYHYCMLVHSLKGSFEDFCELFLRDRAPVGPIWSHILGFWNRRHQPNILFLKYEDMKRDQEGAIRQTAAFLGKEVSEEGVKQLADYLSFGKMRANPAVNLEPIITQTHGAAFFETTDMRFIRKGQVGDWRNHMTPELAARFDSWTEENLRGSGLSFE